MYELVSFLQKFLSMPEKIRESSTFYNLSVLTKKNGQVQYDYMKQDNCIVVDNADNALSFASKEKCHYADGLLHRAFSLFLFRQRPNSSSLELLMQQRSRSKLTFPLLWTNTCCSHPCLNYCGENEEHDALGVRRAARRKVEHELGIDVSKSLHLEDIHFLTRIKYSAPNEPLKNEWCEREVDYLLVSILPSHLSNTFSSFLNINPNEVADARWISEESLMASFSNDPLIYTPWFRKITNQGLLHKMWLWATAKVADSDTFMNFDEVFDRSAVLDLD
ncbi:hypothetical protein Aperf_G00000015555 [Anoplocephala perfoliata]